MTVFRPSPYIFTQYTRGDMTHDEGPTKPSLGVTYMISEGLENRLSGQASQFCFDFLEGDDINDKTSEYKVKEVVPQSRDEPVSPVLSGCQELFFFHVKSDKLRNRLDETEFYRSTSIKDLFTNWSAKRREVRTTYNKVRKESLRKVQRRTH